MLYNLKENLALKQILCLLNIQFIDVEVKDYGKQIGCLLKLDNFKNGEEINKNNFEEKMLIMSDFNDQQLDMFLQIIRTNKISIPLKAIVTATNINWTSLQIRNELYQEYLYMQNRKNK